MLSIRFITEDGVKQIENKNIKPCPFCGEARFFTVDASGMIKAIICGECEARVLDPTLNGLIERWNTRVNK